MMRKKRDSEIDRQNTYRMFGFTRKFKTIETHPPFDVVEAFAICTNNGTHMSAASLRCFLVDFQADDGCSAAGVVHEVLRRRQSTSSLGLTIEDFFYFLLFADDLNSPINDQVHHDMSAPLQHYFIYTGHNSYLTGNQLSSECSDEPIIKALHRGVKVIELDLWPNSRKDDIDVLHGRTLTPPVPLMKCLISINEHAFAKSPYPVILTLEDHLTPDLQARVAKMLGAVFGEQLYYPESEHIQHFPSPEDLKFRIIVSTKPPKEYFEPEKSKVDSDTEEDEDDVEFENDDTSRSVVQSGVSDVSEYKLLIAIYSGKPKKGLREALKKDLDMEKVRRLSLSEYELEKAAVDHGLDIVRFTQNNFLRIYPKGTRITSSNYMPVVGWKHGAQMVAFNMQGYGKSLWIMHGMFRSNGGCGYVKKPDFLLSNGPNGEVFDPKVTAEVKTNLTVRVYMGDGWRMDFSKTHFDTFSPPDFYVKLYIIGVEGDNAKKRTKVIEDDWIPHWDEEFRFSLTVPELALLRIEVREYDRSEKDDFGGQTCLPVSELKPGIRSVPLFDRKGEKLPSVRLLMKFQFS